MAEQGGGRAAAMSVVDVHNNNIAHVQARKWGAMVCSSSSSLVVESMGVNRLGG